MRKQGSQEASQTKRLLERKAEKSAYYKVKVTDSERTSGSVQSDASFDDGQLAKPGDPDGRRRRQETP